MKKAKRRPQQPKVRNFVIKNAIALGKVKTEFHQTKLDKHATRAQRKQKFIRDQRDDE